MSIALERSLEAYGPQHGGLLAVLTFSGIDVSPVVGGARRLIGYGATKHGYGPACILDLIETDYVVEPHIIWMPWTNATQRLAHFRWSMPYLAAGRQVLFNVEKKEISFFEHFVKKGLLRKIGFIDNLPVVEEIHMYQVKKESLHV